MLRVRHRFLPIRMLSRADDSVDLILELENASDQQPLVSLVFVLPKDSPLSFDKLGVQHVKKVRVGHMDPYSSKEFYIPIYAKRGVKPGLYKVGLIIYLHGDNYNEILHEEKKVYELRVV